MLSNEYAVPWKDLLRHPYARMHFVQLYEPDASSLASNVTYFASEGLKRGDGVLTVATPEHQRAFCAGLSGKWPQNQLVLRDAHATLARLTKDGQPDWHGFAQVVGNAIASVRPSNEAGGIRVYSEMAGILWKAHQFAAAVHLEHFWNKLMARSPFSLFCGYSMDVFHPDLHNENLDDVLCAHSHLVPSAPNGILKSALWRAMDEVLGEKSHEIRNLSLAGGHASWVVVPEEEAMVLWLTKHLPDQVQKVVKRARHHYEKLAAVAA